MSSVSVLHAQSLLPFAADASTAVAAHRRCSRMDEPPPSACNPLTEPRRFYLLKVADIMLWRQKNVTLGILIVALAAWVVFEISGYTLLSLVSSVLLLLFSILFFWSKSAEILNRPAPPLPKLQLSEEVVNEAAAFIREHVNALLSVSENIALGKDPKMFVKVTAILGLISLVGGFTDFLTFGYIGLVIVLTVPAVYERYEDHIDRYILAKYWKLHEIYLTFDEYFEACVAKIRDWVLEAQKLS